MHRILVIGSVCHDRIWLLDGPFTAGARLRFSDRRTQLGGGAYYTGRQLLDLDADVTLVTRLMDDEDGRAARASLSAAGFDDAHITMAPGKTEPLEILLEPNGERTIIAPSRARSIPLEISSTLDADAAYVNAVHLGEKLVGDLEAIPLIVSQLPLDPATPRPADFVITSRSDVSNDISAAWHRARQVCGPRLRTLVVTDGPRPITLFDGRSNTNIQPPATVEATDTIGAGDRFAGSFLLAILQGHAPSSAAFEASRVTVDWLREKRLIAST
ncbi:PfkB family carbohydrate kinase [Rhizobium jaguaris]|uniref:PfkB family carbohydrate kinase n=1 Tax=Rhizobium jaguaris TaxID=1312183 RepID=UPI0013C42B6A|nr:PfkB family carbohydrate kinase [Rhizobium jaguaris]